MSKLVRISWAGSTAALAVAMLASCDGEIDSTRVGTHQAGLCSSGQLTSNQARNTAVGGTQVLWTASATCEYPNPEYIFYRHAPEGGWTVACGWGPTATCLWDTTGSPPGRYDWQVWMRENGSGVPYEAYASMSFELTSTSSCTSVSASTTPFGSATSGQSVQINGSAACGTAQPEYQIYHYPPGGSWMVLSPYTAATPYVWDTASEPLGYHYFQVWARAVGSTRPYEAYGAFTVRLRDAGCTDVRLAATPNDYATIGTQVGFLANAAGCDSPSYQYWGLAPDSSSWVILRDWGDAAFIWDTTNAAVGNHGIQVWVRGQGTSEIYDTYAGTTYGLYVGSTVGIASGAQHACERHDSGGVACWGWNQFGQVGNGANADSVTPASVASLGDAVTIAAGYTHTCALLGDGSGRCWGSNLHGQLGNSSNTDSNVPVGVSGLAGATALSLGTAHSCAVVAGGVRCWGYNSQGQLGDGTRVNRSVPVAVPGLTRTTELAAAYYHTCALLSGGEVRCWGANDVGNLGTGATSSQPILTPVAVQGLSNVTAISASSGHTCAVLADQTVRCWGANNNGVLGNGTNTLSASPVAVAGLSGVVSISAAPYHNCAVRTDGSVYCWGLNSYGALGDGTTNESWTPVPVIGLAAPATAVAAGWYHTCATLTDGSAACWGYNGTGQLGSVVNGGYSVQPVVVSPAP